MHAAQQLGARRAAPRLTSTRVTALRLHDSSAWRATQQRAARSGRTCAPLSSTADQGACLARRPCAWHTRRLLTSVRRHVAARSVLKGRSPPAPWPRAHCPPNRKRPRRRQACAASKRARVRCCQERPAAPHMQQRTAWTLGGQAPVRLPACCGDLPRTAPPFGTPPPHHRPAEAAPRLAQSGTQQHAQPHLAIHAPRAGHATWVPPMPAPTTVSWGAGSSDGPHTIACDQLVATTTMRPARGQRRSVRGFGPPSWPPANMD